MKVKKIKPFKATKKHKETKLNEQVKLLNEVVKVRLAPSSIHGIGVFAIRDLKKGEKMYLDAIPHQFDLPFERFSELEGGISDILLGCFPQIVNGSHFLYPITRMQAYTNHSDDPNYDGKEDVMLRDLKAGEEITEDYRQIEGWEKIFIWLK